MIVSPETLEERAAFAWENLAACTLCPRECKADRLAGERGYCGSEGRWGIEKADPESVLISSAGPHYGEEGCLVGRGGSGTVFFSGCNLSCMFCQNAEISQGGEGTWVSLKHLASTFLSLQRRGCHNLNIVTPTHFVAHLLKALAIAVKDGFKLPLVYNCGGYESLETLKLLDGVVDIYMPDFKYADAETALRLSDVPDYPDRAKAALSEMHRQVGDLRIDGPAGTATRGLLVRHLVLPRNLAGSDEVMRFLATEISTDTYVNIMDQYRPCHRADCDRALSVRLTPEEYQAAIDAATRYGLHRGFTREQKHLPIW
ncbi:MAG: radical SAM protein [bacterium]